MIIKSAEEIAIMREGGKILSTIIEELSKSVRSGLSTYELEEIAKKLCKSYEVKPSFLGYDDFPAILCISINEEIVHGVPSDRIIKKGDLVKIDMGISCKGFHTDSAVTILVPGGEDVDIKSKLLNVTQEALRIGISKAIAGNTLGDLGHAIQSYVEDNGFNVVRDLVGHGIGKNLHEDPQVPNYGRPGEGLKLQNGMVLAIEPMVVIGSWKVALGDDGFAFKTKDLSLSCHFEHTVAITEKGPLTITA
jgi:methionyl aminopeptidase